MTAARRPAPDGTAATPISRRELLGAGAATAAVAALPRAARGAGPGVVLDDASRLNPTPMARHWRPTEVTGLPWLDALRAELKAAAADRRPVVVGAARHSMGGQALAPGGVAMTLDVRAGSPERWIEVNRQAGTYRVAAGARWRQVIGALDPLGLSPAVMQSNHDFGIAATLSVNAHGWPVPHVELARRGRTIEEIAGNRRILTTALMQAGRAPAVPGARQLFAVPVQSRPGWLRVGWDVSVPELAAAIRRLEEDGAAVEHVYDY